MEEQKNYTQYDEMMQTREVQMLKTMVPFLANDMQLKMAMIIQYLEIRNTMSLFTSGKNALSACQVPEGTDRRSAMLQALKAYCSPKEKETIDMMINLFSVMELYE